MSQLAAELDRAMLSMDCVSCSSAGRCAAMPPVHVVQTRISAADDAPLSFDCCMFASRNFTTGSEQRYKIRCFIRHSVGWVLSVPLAIRPKNCY